VARTRHVVATKSLFFRRQIWKSPWRVLLADNHMTGAAPRQDKRESSTELFFVKPASSCLGETYVTHAPAGYREWKMLRRVAEECRDVRRA
jgi:hypothetical protein